MRPAYLASTASLTIPPRRVRYERSFCPARHKPAGQLLTHSGHCAISKHAVILGVFSTRRLNRAKALSSFRLVEVALARVWPSALIAV
jgi:hypothetical protein